MILAGDKYGHPWHGLWRAADNKILSPAGVLVDTPGVAPSAQFLPGLFEFPPGDAFLVQVPGQPAVSNSPADDAAGRAWTNYGVISGLRHRFCGKVLDTSGWLYVAPDKSVWMCMLSYTPASKTVGVSFRRFGDFRPGMEQDYSVKTAAHTASITAQQYMIDDINSDGSQVLLTLFDEQYNGTFLGQNVLKSGLRYCKGGLKVTLSGQPPAATLTVAVMVDTAACEGVREVVGAYAGTYYAIRRNAQGNIVEMYTQNVSWVWPAAPPDYSGPSSTAQGWGDVGFVRNAFDQTIRRRDVMTGLAFDSAGAAQVVKLTYETRVIQSFTITPGYSGGNWWYGFTGTANATGFYKLGIGSATHQVNAQSSATCAASNVSFTTHETTGGPGSQTVTRSFGSFSETFTESIIRLPGADALVYQSGPYDAQFAVVSDSTYIFALPVRYGNGLYGPALIRTDPGYSVVSVKYHGVMSPFSVDSAEVAGTALAQHFATANPKTHAISRSSTPVCFV